MFKTERLDMSGKPRVMWAITKDGVRQFPTNDGHSAWTKKREAVAVINHITKYGYEETKRRLGHA